MEKLLHERLRDWNVAADKRFLYPGTIAEGEVLDDVYKHDNRTQMRLFEWFADEIERNYIPLSCDSDGNPWKIGDDCITSEGEEATIVGYRGNGKVFIDLHDERCYARCYAFDLKRPKEPDSLKKLLADMVAVISPTQSAHEEFIERFSALIERGA